MILESKNNKAIVKLDDGTEIGGIMSANYFVNLDGTQCLTLTVTKSDADIETDNVLIFSKSGTKYRLVKE